MKRAFASWRTCRFLVPALSLLSFHGSLAAHGVHAKPGRLTVSDARKDGARSWLAGDHHVHSRFSAGYAATPVGSAARPVAMLGGDGRYATPRNAAMARRFGLAWMVTTDHGGPDHSKLDYEQAYPELLKSRLAVPEVLQFYGMEFDTPGGDHSSLIVPRSDAERQTLLDIEHRFSKREAWPLDPARDTEPRMIDALRHMRGLSLPPVVIANHPARSATGLGAYEQYDPAEFRDWNDAAPDVAIGMEGAPGHQAASLRPDGTLDPKGVRGSYGRAPTMGGFDQMTARLGGFWDSMLGEGRRWWVTSTSDSHVHYTDGGDDFWPGEYSKTYVRARRDHADILDGLRRGRVFVTTGDLVSALDVTARAGRRTAGIGGSLAAAKGDDVRVTIRARDPERRNAGGRDARVARIDLIAGTVTGRRPDRAGDSNPSTRVLHRFTKADWRRDGEYLTMSYTLRNVAAGTYVRVRGTSTDEMEPGLDASGEDPWSDLWFYSNPIFVEIR